MNIVKHVFIYRDFKVEVIEDWQLVHSVNGLCIKESNNITCDWEERKIDFDNVLIWLQLNEDGGVEDIWETKNRE